MDWNPFAPKHPDTSEADAYIARDRKRQSGREASARIDAALDRMERKSAEMGRERARLRAKCPLDNHDRCLSH